MARLAVLRTAETDQEVQAGAQIPAGPLVRGRNRVMLAVVAAVPAREAEDRRPDRPGEEIGSWAGSRQAEAGRACYRLPVVVGPCFGAKEGRARQIRIPGVFLTRMWAVEGRGACLARRGVLDNGRVV